MQRHLNPEALLRFSDGDLPAAERNGAERHCAECAECRGQQSDIAEGWKEYLNYRAEALLRGNEAPAAWSDLQDGMAAIDASIRTRRKQRAIPNPWWRRAIAGLAAASLIAAFYSYRQLPSVQAAELLLKATQAAAALPPQPRARIRIHTRRRDVVRPAAVPSGDRDELASLFAAAGFDWSLPFSARAFGAWRDRLADKNDSVERYATDDRTGTPVFLIRTSSATNALASATLVLRASDYSPVREVLEFRADESVEITSAVAEPPAMTAPARSAEPAPRLAAGLPLPIRQLRVLAALHSIHADLGEVEMLAAGQTLRLQGTDIAEARRREIERAIAGVEGVQSSFDSEPRAPAPGARTTSAGTAAPDAPLRGLLASKLGGGAWIDEVTDRILDTSDAMLAQAFALRSLAERFPPMVEAAMPDADRAALLRLRTDYSREFLAQFERLAQLLSPLASVGRPIPRDGGTWQDRASAILAAAKSLDAVLNAGFAATATAAPAEMSKRLADSLRAAADAAGASQ
jgi:hypothetical protein